MKTLGYGIAFSLLVTACGSTGQTVSKTPPGAATNPPISSPSTSSKDAAPASTIKKAEAPKLILVPRDTANIGPADLYCSVLTKPTDAAPSAAIGCRFEEAGNRVALSAVAASVKFAANVVTGVTYKADISDTTNWDVVYTITSTSLPATLKTSLATVMTNTVTGENRQTLSMPLSSF